MVMRSRWFPVARRGKVIGFEGAGYQATTVATYVVCGQAGEERCECLPVS